MHSILYKLKYKEVESPRLKKEKAYAQHYIAYFIDHHSYWRSPHLALQRWLGILSERRIGIGAVDRDYPNLAGTRLRGASANFGGSVAVHIYVVTIT
jgi:hypothetical protein